MNYIKEAEKKNNMDRKKKNIVGITVNDQRR